MSKGDTKTITVEIDTLGSYNLFANKFVIGTPSVNKGYTKTNTEEIEALHRWLKFKEEDQGMDNYRPANTQSIQFLKIIDVPLFNDVVKDLHRAYKRKFIHSTNSDFVQNVFEYTISSLKRLLKCEEEGDLIWMDGPPGEKVYTYYRYSSGINQQGIELAIKRDDDIDNYIQHYRHVLSTLDGLDALINTAKIQDIADPVIEDISVDIAERVMKHFDFFQKKCPRRHRIILSETDFDKLIGWTISFYRNEFEVPEINEPIQKVDTNRTYVRLAFKYLFKVFYPSHTIYPDSLFTFYTKAFHEYRDEKKTDFIKVARKQKVRELMKLER